MLRQVAGSCWTARAGEARMLPVAWRGTAERRVLGRGDGSQADAELKEVIGWLQLRARLVSKNQALGSQAKGMQELYVWLSESTYADCT